MPRRWPGLVLVPMEVLLPMEVKFLDSGVFRRPRSRSSAAGRSEDQQPRREEEQQRNSRCCPQLRRLKLILGRPPSAAGNVLGRMLAEAYRRERKAPLLRQLRTFYDLLAIRSRGIELKRRTRRSIARRWSNYKKMVTLILDGVISGRARSETSFLPSTAIEGGCCARLMIGLAASHGPMIRGTSTGASPWVRPKRISRSF